MKSAVLVAAAILVSISPARSQTPERTATLVGESYEGYARSRFLCLSKGYAMPTLEEINPGSEARAKTAKKDYAAFYQLGAEKGVAMANDTFGDDSFVLMLCKTYVEQMKKLAQKKP